jgi:hypothetical protein
LGSRNAIRHGSRNAPVPQRRWRLPLYAARIEDLGLGDFVNVDCAACYHVALLILLALAKAGVSPTAKVLN